MSEGRPGDDLAALPHRPPFLFVSGIDRVDGDAIHATWRVEGTEDFLRGHFPANPIVPGVLVCEALAQTAGLLLAARPDLRDGPVGVGYLAQIDVRFHAPTRPPADLQLVARHEGRLGSLHRFGVIASCGEGRVASGTLVLAVPADPDPIRPDASRDSS